MIKLITLIIAFQLMIIPVPRAHAGGIGGMANQLRGMAIGGIGATIITTCKFGALSPSVKIFMAAALAYIAGELAAGKGQNKAIDSESDKVDSTKNGQGGETQLATLEAQLKDKEEKKKVADKRAMFTAASMALMTAAAIVAVTEIPRTLPPVPTIPPVLACNVPEAAAKAKITASAIAAAFTFATGGGLMGGLMSGIGMYAVGLSPIVALINTAPGRVKAFGALAVFTGLALMDVKGESSKLAKEIQDLKDVIAQFKKETDDPGKTNEDTTGGATGGVTSGSDAGLLAGTTGGASNAVNALPTGQSVTSAKVCVTSSGPSSDCANSLKVPSVDLSGLGTAPEVQQIASQGSSLGNDIATGNAGAQANIAAASIGASAAKLNSELKKQLAKANANLKAKGEKQIDFDKEVADTVKSVNSATQAQAAKSGQLAMLGNGSTSLDPNAAAKAAQDINAASSGAAIQVPTANGDAAAAVPADPNAEALAAANAQDKTADINSKDALGNNLNDYESSETDISKNKEDSLWKQVSNRYLLNYQRFFEKNKVVPTPAQ